MNAQQPQPTRPSRAGWLIAVVLALVAGILVPPPAEAEPPVPKVAAAAAPALTSDISGSLPRVGHDEAVGDFLKLGYQQRAVVEDGNLNIYAPPSRGGNRLRSTPTDLEVPKDGDLADTFIRGKIRDVAVAQRLSSIYLAWTPDGFYLAGAVEAGQALDKYGVVLYKLPPDGSCGTWDCAIWIKTDVDDYALVFLDFVYASVTSLAVGRIGDRSVLAVAMSVGGDLLSGPSNQRKQLGIIIVDADTGSTLGTFNDHIPSAGPSGPGAQYVTTSVAWDPAGTGLLSFGMITNKQSGRAVMVNADGTFGRFTNWDSEVGDDVTPVVLSTAIGRLADGRTPVVAFGMSDGTVKLWDPAATSPNLVASYTPTGGDPNDPPPIDAVTFVDRVIGTAGAQDIVAVSSKKDSAVVLRYDGATALKTQNVGSGGVTTTTRGGIQSWFPGYKAGRIRFANIAYEPLSISFSTRPNEAYGCWFAPAFPASGVFPASEAFPSGSEIRLETAQITGRYTVGGLTAAVSGNCAGDKDDSVAQWAAYLVVTPIRRPADTVTVKLVVNRDGTVTTTTVGGGLTVSQEHATGGWVLGDTTLRIRGPQAPRPTAPLTLKGVQLDPVGTERPVYRLDVPASAWTAPRTTPARVSMVVDPITVWGFNGQRLVQLGLLAPQGVPARSGSSGSVTLAPVSFYWRNPPVGQGDQITSFQLQSGSVSTSYVTSNVVQLASLTPTADGAVVSSVSVCPVDASAKCDDGAQPFANGLDQTPVRIQLFDESNTVLPISDPGYGRVYYTDQDDQLVTGLIPLAPEATYVRVSPYPGAYANDGVSPTTPRTPPTKVGGRYGYVSTNDPNKQILTAHVGGVLREGGDIGIDARTFSSPALQASGSQLSVSNGFYLTGCSGDDDSRCALANPKTTATAFQPALYFTTDPDDGKLKIGLQFATVAQTATSSLPLQQVANQDEHLVAAAGLAINAGEISFSAAASNFQPADNITTWVVTHGQQVQIRSVNVGQSN